MKVTLLGTGSPLPSQRRASTGHLIETERATIIIDLGPGACRRLVELGSSPASVTDIFVSHLHFDHIGDLPTLLFYCWDRFGGIGRLPRIHGPVGIAHFVERLFGEDGAFAADITARTSHPISLAIYGNRGGGLPRPRPRFEILEFDGPGCSEGDGWRIGRFPVLHHQPYLESFGFRLEAEGGIFAYSSDVQISDKPDYEASVIELARDADVLVHYLNEFDFHSAEGSSSRQSALARLAAKARVKTLVTTHHGPAMDSAEIEARMLQDLRQFFDGHVLRGEDLQSFTIPST